MLVGRELQEKVGQRPQAVFIMHLLVGTEGQKKMSKSLGNTIDFEDPPGEKYGKVMSIPDAALLQYLELATDIPDEELRYIAKQLEERSVNPMDVKKRLAREIVAQFHGDAAASEAEAEWGRTFQEREAPSDAIDVPAENDLIDLVGLLVEYGLASSKAEARRLIHQGAVELDGAKVPADEAAHLAVASGTVIRVGKHRFLRIVDADHTSSETS
jgi:tyrosyl-tRNA synthetase